MSTHEDRQQVKETKQNARSKPESEAEEETRENELLDLANNMTVAMLRRRLQQHGQKVSTKQNKAQLVEAYVDLMKKEAAGKKTQDERSSSGRSSKSTPKAAFSRGRAQIEKAQEQVTANKKRKRTDDDYEHEDELERLGRTSGGNKIRKTESVDKKLQQQHQTVNLQTQKRDIPAFLRGPAQTSQSRKSSLSSREQSPISSLSHRLHAQSAKRPSGKEEKLSSQQEQTIQSKQEERMLPKRATWSERQEEQQVQRENTRSPIESRGPVQTEVAPGQKAKNLISSWAQRKEEQSLQERAQDYSSAATVQEPAPLRETQLASAATSELEQAKQREEAKKRKLEEERINVLKLRRRALELEQQQLRQQESQDASIHYAASRETARDPFVGTQPAERQGPLQSHYEHMEYQQPDSSISHYVDAQQQIPESTQRVYVPLDRDVEPKVVLQERQHISRYPEHMYEPEPSSKSSKREMFTMGQAIQGGSTSNRRSVLSGRGSLPPTVPREEFFTESTQPKRMPLRRGFETMRHRDLNNSYIEVDKNQFRAETPQAYGIKYRKNRTSSDHKHQDEDLEPIDELSRKASLRQESRRRALAKKDKKQTFQDFAQIYMPLFLFGAFVALVIGISAYAVVHTKTKETYCPDSSQPDYYSVFEYPGYKHKETCEGYKEDRHQLEQCQLYKGCKECPQEGICDRGDFKGCLNNKVKEGEKCVTNTRLRNAAYDILKNFEYLLQKRHGDMLCGIVQDKRMNIQEFRAFIEQESTLYQREKLNADALLDETWKILMGYEQVETPLDIAVEYLDFTQPSLQDFRQRDDIFLYSKEKTRTFSCMVKELILDNIFAILVGSFIAVYSSYQIFMWRRSMNKQKLAKKLFSQIKSDLNNVQGNITGLSQSDILRRYLQTPKGTDQLKRDEATFYKQVWPILEQLRKKERSIQTYDRMQFGKEVPIWQLK